MPTTLDEAITRDAVTGTLRGESRRRTCIVCVLDPHQPAPVAAPGARARGASADRMIVALNMSDLAQRRGFRLDRAALERELGVPVVETVAVRPAASARCWPGIDAPLDCSARSARRRVIGFTPLPPSGSTLRKLTASHQREVRRILRDFGYVEPLRDSRAPRLDAVVMHPVAGPLLLAVLLFLMFQAVFSWAQAPVAWITAGMDALGTGGAAAMPAGPLRSLLVERRHRRRRQRAGVPAADPDPVLLHPAARGSAAICRARRSCSIG